MIPRYQKVLFYVLVAGIILMAVFLFYEHKRAQDRLAAATDATPIAAPVASSTETLTFDLANDADGTITAEQRQLALPEEPSVRARALLERLLAEYALPGSTHPLGGGAAVDDVFLLKLPIVSPRPPAEAHAAPASTTQPDTTPPDGAGELAVINLRGTFIDKHPSGVEVETLTIQSMLGTLHANFPQITQVRFLVDGQPHDTLAGHADLTRVYPVDDTTTQGAQATGSGDSAVNQPSSSKASTATPINAPSLTAEPISAAPIAAAPIHAASILAPTSEEPLGGDRPNLTLGVFDSGFGGLTVLRELLPLLPGAHSLYLGDTARLPYGSKSRETISRYTLSSARFLQDQGADLIVIACNTATALALDNLRRELPIPVLGVIQPGAEAARTSHADTSPQAAASNSTVSDPSVLVLATSATVQSRAYTRALEALGLAAYEMPCPLLVPLVEEGWIDHPVTDGVLKIYLEQALTAAPNADTLLLGCTHYPLLEPAIRRTLATLGHPLQIIDSAHATAHATARLVAQHFPAAHAETAAANLADSTCSFYATDSVEKFQRLGSHFLGRPLDRVHLIDLGG